MHGAKDGAHTNNERRKASMNSMSIIRKYEEDDRARVQAAAERFCKRHNIRATETAEESIQFAIATAHPEDRARLRELWMGCYCRALRVPYNVRTTTMGGQIGLRCE